MEAEGAVVAVTEMGVAARVEEAEEVAAAAGRAVSAATAARTVDTHRGAASESGRHQLAGPSPHRRDTPTFPSPRLSLALQVESTVDPPPPTAALQHGCTLFPHARRWRRCDSTWGSMCKAGSQPLVRRRMADASLLERHGERQPPPLRRRPRRRRPRCRPRR